MFGWFWNIVDKIINKRAMLITGKQLKLITSLPIERCEEMAEMLNKKSEEYGVKTIDEFEEFLANVIQESGEFRHKSEDMSYSAKRIMQLFPKRFPTLAIAQQYAHKPKEFANKLYGGRYGNRPGTDDGWNLRGGGFIGLTFYDTWKKYADYKKMTVEQASEYVRTSDEGALDSAFWFYYVLKDLKRQSVDDNFIGIVKSINGGTIGLSTRHQYYIRIQRVLGS
jgi:putative chitinase